MALSVIDTLKRIGKETLLLPGTGVYMLSALIFGSKEPVGDIFTVKEEKTGSQPAPNPRQHQHQHQDQHHHHHHQHKKPQREKKTEGFPGLFGFLGAVLTKVGQAITTFVKNNRVAISAILWTSLIVGVAVALTVAFWPAALAALAGLSIGGLSIAAIVGASYVAQVLAVGSAAAVLAGVAASALAVVGNVGMWIKNHFYPEAPSKKEDEIKENIGRLEDPRNHPNAQEKEPIVHQNPLQNQRKASQADAIEIDMDGAPAPGNS